LIPYRKLSIALTDLLAEAQALVDLKTKLGRLPNSTVKTVAMREIDEWFEATGEDTTRETVKPKLTDSCQSPSAGSQQQGVGFLRDYFSDKSDMADKVPDDDDIPF